jgi:hypothetical protein
VIFGLFSTPAICFEPIKHLESQHRDRKIFREQSCPKLNRTKFKMMPLLLKFAALFQLLLIATESDAISVLDYYEAQINGRTYNVSSTICRDVSIIGGGSAGCYSAVHLRDYNQSVLVIEQQDRLGGHTQTYTDPTTGKHVELGVQIFYDTDVVKNYFSRFNIPTFLMNITGSLEQKRLSVVYHYLTR